MRCGSVPETHVSMSLPSSSRTVIVAPGTSSSPVAERLETSTLVKSFSSLAVAWAPPTSQSPDTSPASSTWTVRTVSSSRCPGTGLVSTRCQSPGASPSTLRVPSSPTTSVRALVADAGSSPSSASHQANSVPGRAVSSLPSSDFVTTSEFFSFAASTVTVTTEVCSPPVDTVNSWGVPSRTYPSGAFVSTNA